MTAALQDRIEADVKTAMRERDELARDTLRMVLAALKNRRIEAGRELEDSDVVAVLRKAIKSRAESAEQYAAAGRAELAERERAEAAIVERYLPKQLGEGETRAIVEALVAELGLTSRKDVGLLMKTVMARHQGEVDGRTVQRIAGELLA